MVKLYGINVLDFEKQSIEVLLKYDFFEHPVLELIYLYNLKSNDIIHWTFSYMKNLGIKSLKYKATIEVNYINENNKIDIAAKDPTFSKAISTLKEKENEFFEECDWYNQEIYYFVRENNFDYYMNYNTPYIFGAVSYIDDGDTIHVEVNTAKGLEKYWDVNGKEFSASSISGKEVSARFLGVQSPETNKSEASAIIRADKTNKEYIVSGIINKANFKDLDLNDVYKVAKESKDLWQQFNNSNVYLINNKEYGYDLEKSPGFDAYKRLVSIVIVEVENNGIVLRLNLNKTLIRNRSLVNSMLKLAVPFPYIDGKTAELRSAPFMGDTLLYSIDNLAASTITKAKNEDSPRDKICEDFDLVTKVIDNKEYFFDKYYYYATIQGDTVEAVANKYKISVDELLKLNNLSSDNPVPKAVILDEGTILLVPFNTEIDLQQADIMQLTGQFRMGEKIPNNILVPADSQVEAYDAPIIDDRDKLDGIIRFLDGQDKVELSDPAYSPYGKHYLRIGDCTFPISPLSIASMRETKGMKIPTLRSRNSLQTGTGYSNHTLSIELYFSGLDDINGKPTDNPIPGESMYYRNGLRPLIAQFMKAPFLPIENELINASLDVHEVALQDLQIETVPGFPNCIKATLILLQFNHTTFMPQSDWFEGHFCWPLYRWYYQRMMQPSEKFKGHTYLPPVEKFTNKLNFKIPSEKVLKERQEAINKLVYKMSPERVKSELNDVKSSGDKEIVNGMNQYANFRGILSRYPKGAYQKLYNNGVIDISQASDYINSPISATISSGSTPGDVDVNNFISTSAAIKYTVAIVDIYNKTYGVSAKANYKIPGMTQEIIDKCMANLLIITNNSVLTDGNKTWQEVYNGSLKIVDQAMTLYTAYNGVIIRETDKSVSKEDADALLKAKMSGTNALTTSMWVGLAAAVAVFAIGIFFPAIWGYALGLGMAAAGIGAGIWSYKGQEGMMRDQLFAAAPKSDLYKSMPKLDQSYKEGEVFSTTSLSKDFVNKIVKDADISNVSDTSGIWVLDPLSKSAQVIGNQTIGNEAIYNAYKEQINNLEYLAHLSEQDIPTEDFIIDGDYYIQSVSTTLSNRFAPLQTQMQESPTFQYLGGSDVVTQLEIVTKDREVIKSFNELMSTIQYFNRQYRIAITSGVLSFDHPFFQLFGMTAAVIDSCNISTSKSDKESFTLNIVLTSFEKTQRRKEELDQFGFGENFTDKGQLDRFKAQNLNSFGENYGTVDLKLKSAEVYPDLQLPTYKELDQALPYLKIVDGHGNKFLKYPNFTKGKYVDPDFYIRCELTQRDIMEHMLSQDQAYNAVVNDKYGGTITDVAPTKQQQKDGTKDYNSNVQANDQASQSFKNALDGMLAHTESLTKNRGTASSFYTEDLDKVLADIKKEVAPNLAIEESSFTEMIKVDQSKVNYSLFINDLGKKAIDNDNIMYFPINVDGVGEILLPIYSSDSKIIETLELAKKNLGKKWINDTYGIDIDLMVQYLQALLLSYFRLGMYTADSFQRAPILLIWNKYGMLDASTLDSKLIDKNYDMYNGYSVELEKEGIVFLDYGDAAVGIQRNKTLLNNYWKVIPEAETYSQEKSSKAKITLSDEQKKGIIARLDSYSSVTYDDTDLETIKSVGTIQPPLFAQIDEYIKDSTFFKYVDGQFGDKSFDFGEGKTKYNFNGYWENYKKVVLAGITTPDSKRIFNFCKEFEFEKNKGYYRIPDVIIEALVEAEKKVNKNLDFNNTNYLKSWYFRNWNGSTNRWDDILLESTYYTAGGWIVDLTPTYNGKSSYTKMEWNEEFRLYTPSKVNVWVGTDNMQSGDTLGWKEINSSTPPTNFENMENSQALFVIDRIRGIHPSGLLAKITYGYGIIKYGDFRKYAEDRIIKALKKEGKSTTDKSLIDQKYRDEYAHWSINEISTFTWAGKDGDNKTTIASAVKYQSREKNQEGSSKLFSIMTDKIPCGRSYLLPIVDSSQEIMKSANHIFKDWGTFESQVLKANEKTPLLKLIRKAAQYVYAYENKDYLSGGNATTKDLNRYMIVMKEGASSLSYEQLNNNLMDSTYYDGTGYNIWKNIADINKWYGYIFSIYLITDSDYLENAEFVNMLTQKEFENITSTMSQATAGIDLTGIYEQSPGSKYYGGDAMSRIEDPDLGRLYRTSFDSIFKYDMTSRMVQAFPAYQIYIIDEGVKTYAYRMWDNFFGYNSILSMDILKDRRIIADTATIEMSNIYHNLSTYDNEITYGKADFNVFDAFGAGGESKFNDFWNTVWGIADIDMIKARQEELNSLFLKAGARLHIRQGYGSNAYSMPVMFNGTITELNTDEVITIVAQGDGLELTNKLNFGADTTTDLGPLNAPYEPREFIGQILTSKGNLFQNLVNNISMGTFFNASPLGIVHFGAEGLVNNKVLLDQIPLVNIFPSIADLPVDYGEAGVNIYEGGKAASFSQWVYMGKDTETLSKTFKLYGPSDVSGQKRMTEESGNFFGWRWNNGDLIPRPQLNDAPNVRIYLRDMTSNDVFQTYAAACPDYICAVRPFEFRSTLFFGKPNWGIAERYYYAYYYSHDMKNMKREKIGYDRKTFSQTHICTSVTNIIKNGLTATADNMRTNVSVIYNENNGAKQTATMQVDSDIYPQFQTTGVIHTPIKADGTDPTGSYNYFNQHAYASSVGTTQLKDWVKEMYQGDIVLIGNPAINPYDSIYLHDTFVDMKGFIEVKRVTHHLSTSTGFITVIQPDCVCIVDDGGKISLLSWIGPRIAGVTAFILGEVAHRTLLKRITKLPMPYIVKQLGGQSIVYLMQELYFSSAATTPAEKKLIKYYLNDITQLSGTLRAKYALDGTSKTLKAVDLDAASKEMVDVIKARFLDDYRVTTIDLEKAKINLDLFNKKMNGKTLTKADNKALKLLTEDFDKLTSRNLMHLEILGESGAKTFKNVKLTPAAAEKILKTSNVFKAIQTKSLTFLDEILSPGVLNGMIDTIFNKGISKFEVGAVRGYFGKMGTGFVRGSLVMSKFGTKVLGKTTASALRGIVTSLKTGIATTGVGLAIDFVFSVLCDTALEHYVRWKRHRQSVIIMPIYYRGKAFHAGLTGSKGAVLGTAPSAIDSFLMGAGYHNSTGSALTFAEELINGTSKIMGATNAVSGSTVDYGHAEMNAKWKKMQNDMWDEEQEINTTEE